MRARGASGVERRAFRRSGKLRGGRARGRSRASGAAAYPWWGRVSRVKGKAGGGEGDLGGEEGAAGDARGRRRLELEALTGRLRPWRLTGGAWPSRRRFVQDVDDVEHARVRCSFQRRAAFFCQRPGNHSRREAPSSALACWVAPTS